MTTAAVERFTGTARGCVVALGLIKGFDLPDCHVHVHNDGQCVTLEFTGTHGVRDVRYAAAMLGWDLHDSPTDLPDGTAGTEYRAQHYADGILHTLRAVEPVRPLWPVRA